MSRNSKQEQNGGNNRRTDAESAARSMRITVADERDLWYALRRSGVLFQQCGGGRRIIRKKLSGG